MVALLKALQGKASTTLAPCFSCPSFNKRLFSWVSAENVLLTRKFVSPFLPSLGK
jgi:hypothetical protein